MTEGWFDGKICECERFIYRRGDWPFPSDFQSVPTCGTCGKWPDRVQRCCQCKERYYQYFSHPRMGFHVGKGWYCYDCLETFLPDPLPGFNFPKIPPIAEIISPSHTKLERPPPSPQIKAVVDDFDSFLKGLFD